MSFDLHSVGWDRSYADAFHRLSGAGPVPTGPTGFGSAGVGRTGLGPAGAGLSDAAITGSGGGLGRWGTRGGLVDDQPGRVLRVDQGIYTVLTADGVARASLAGSMLARAGTDPLTLPCAGDWLVVRGWSDQRLTVEAVLPRRSVLRDQDDAVRGALVREGSVPHGINQRSQGSRSVQRRSAGRALAANLDTVGVLAPIRYVGEDLDWLVRLVDAAGKSGATPLVVLTMVDQVRDPSAVVAQVSDVLPSVAVITVSAREGYGLEWLRPLVRSGRTLALLGPPGSGRSTLVDAMLGAAAKADCDALVDAGVSRSARWLRRIEAGRGNGTNPTLIPLPGAGAVLTA